MFKKLFPLTPAALGSVFGAITTLTLGSVFVWGLSNHHNLSSSSVCYAKGQDHTAYCDSKGVIQGISINDKGLVVVRLPAAFTVAQAAEHGFDIGRPDAMMMTVDASPQKQEMMAQLRLAYQERLPVTLHAHSVERGHLVLDHIWLR